MNDNRRSGDKRNRSNERKKMSGRRTSARRSAGRRKERPKFPVNDIHNLLCGDDPIEKVEAQAALFLAASEEYVTHEILELACNHAATRGSKEITDNDIILVIHNDQELFSLFGDVIENELNERKEKKEAKEKKTKEDKEKQKRRKAKEKSPETRKTE